MRLTNKIKVGTSPAKRIILLFLFLTALSGCSVIKTISNVSRLKYKIHSARNYTLQGIDLTNKKSVKDFNPLELLKLSTGMIKGNLPLTFLLMIEAKNPNDGSGGYPRTDISIVSFPWRLYLNDKETVSGNIKEPVLVPGKGESVLIPLEIRMDVTELFKEKRIDDILALLLQFGGAKGSTSNIKLMVKPVIGTPLGKIEYPDEITIVDKTFN